MTAPNPDVEALIRRSTKWQPEMKQLGATLRASGLSEALKWGKPCYALNDANVAIIQAFKEHCAVMFFKGALMKDPKKVMVAPGINSQAGRRIEFTSVKDIVAAERLLRAYVAEAIALEKSGAKIDFKQKRELQFPDELTAKLKQTPALATAFAALTPGRQRAYVMHFAGAKQSATRTSRIDKVVPRILKGKGLTDR
jgi:uncharacterized protein YdeI (YjbR/CyaY-like superfamily)